MKQQLTRSILFFILLNFSSQIQAQEEFKPGRKGLPVIRSYNIKLPMFNRTQRIRAEVIDNLVVYQGDIILGPLVKFEGEESVAVDGDSYRWPNSTIPFIIATNHPKRTDILAAIKMINDNTNLCVVPKTNQNDYVKFVSSSGCASYVGKQSGEQEITIGSCGVGSIAHEILHAAGLYHEQSREDRDNFVTINLANITEGKEHNFDKKVSGASDLGNYDYGSIMHYGKTAFSKNGSNTIDIDVPPGTSSTSIGQRSNLSTRDKSAINSLYSKGPCKRGLDVGESKTVTVYAKEAYNFTGIHVTSGQKFRFTTSSPDWKNGSTATDCDGYDGNIIDIARRHNDLKMMALIGEIFVENNSNNYTGHYFRIGCGPRSHTVTKTGYLIAFANDIITAYGDNTGSISLTVTRTE